MLHGESPGLVVGAVALGIIHGIEPGHGWPVAASYALDQYNKWVYGLTASLIIGVGHLISSMMMIAVFFYTKTYFKLTRINDPVTIAGTVEIGGSVSIVAGVLLVFLGIREYRHSHTHASGDGHDHEHTKGHSHQKVTTSPGLWLRVRSVLPLLSTDDQRNRDTRAERGILSIAWFAFVLGFAHEEEFEIIAMCAGSTHCLELMTAYALTVIAGIVSLTLLLIAGHQHYEQRVERYSSTLPVFSAIVLTVMGIGFVLGVF